ncbi:MAG: aspartate kinase [Anaerolineales bacterium]|nr:MAG: aspartate kinase [Anaerolineales bacterium]
MTTLVMKFGGTSVGKAQAITQAASIVQSYAPQWDNLVVVVSAMSGVTDALVNGARTAAAGDTNTYPAIVSDLRVRHTLVIAALVEEGKERSELLKTMDTYLDEFATLCHSVGVLGELTPRAMDAISSLGERINARIFAACLRQMGIAGQAVDATELIVTDNRYQHAVPLMDLTRARVQKGLLPLMAEGAVPVVTGFIAATETGVTTTLGRGGSDYSAAILGAALDADEVWTWTDVDGVMTTDPRIAPDARVIPVLSYSEVGELAYFGAKVLHPKTISPVVERGIPLWVKNTFNPAHPGTQIVREPESTAGTVKAVTAIHGLSMVTVEGRGMMGVPGIAARTFAAVASKGASVLMISQASSEQSICFIIPTEDVPPVIDALESALALELARRDIDRVWAMDDIVVVTAVGAGMRGTPGVAARLFVALASQSINAIAIAQGSSECSISIAVSADQATEAVRQIHREVVNGSGRKGVKDA